ncbi:hypothetical protein Leryth_017814 [Lithospermum erythrorhizon]|nr:hypothetical protein Leryth_017814 [Lithospermum erythrorhizon]
MEKILVGGKMATSLVGAHTPWSSSSYPSIYVSKHINHRLKFKRLATTTTTTRAIPDNVSSGSVSTKDPEVDITLTRKKRANEVCPELKGTSIFLLGMNNSLKTTLGKLLADSLRYYYFDSDSLVEEAVGGRLAAKSFRQRDEKGYHDTETEVLKQLSSMGRLVVSAGDSAVQSATNLALLRHGVSIWLDVPLDIVAREVVNGEIQPFLSGLSISGSQDEVLSELSSLYEARRSGYATADTTISLQKVASELGYDELDAVSTEDLTFEVLKEIEKLVRVKKMMEEAARPF